MNFTRNNYVININNRRFGCKKDINVHSLLVNFECRRWDDHLVEGQDNGNEVPPFACSFCKVKDHSNVLAIADEDGCVVLYDTNKANPTALFKEWLAHQNAIFDIAWMEGDKKLLTASGDQTCVLWDVLQEEKLSVFKGHTSSVKSVEFRPQDKCTFASGARDGKIMLWDNRCGSLEGVSPISTINCAHGPINNSTRKKRAPKKTGESVRLPSVTAVLFQDEYNLISSGATDGIIKVWDIRKLAGNSKTDPMPKFSFPYAGNSIRMHGFSSLVLDESKSRLFASCTDDTIYQFNTANYSPKPEACYKGHQNSTFYVKAALSPEDKFLISGSSDYHAYIWDVNEPQASPVLLKGHVGEVTSVAWCPTDFGKVCTLSDDSTIKFWRLNRRQTQPEPNELVGKAERSHRDIGTSMNGAENVNKDIKQYTQSFEKCGNTSNKLTDLSSGASGATGKLVIHPFPQFSNIGKSPSTIKDWIQNFSKMSAKSPRKFVPASPRRLLISPRKFVHPVPESSKGAVPSKGVKRKLIDMDTGSSSPDQNRGKVRKLEEGDKQALSPVVDNSMRTEKDCKTPVRKVKLNFNDPSFASPTSNLPNYILDPQPRAPCASPSTNGKENSVSPGEWKKTFSKQQKSRVTPKRSDSPRLSRRVSRTSSNPSSRPGSPALGKSPAANKKSILDYFSPKGKK
ncbi:denticleless protein homolog A-like [Lineus longissimus]|uniref:denticleless protein homolog A-like n=1 Tax=Lineus longissimus TaxID=88925 RepID=UPI002B4E4924